MKSLCISCQYVGEPIEEKNCDLKGVIQYSVYAAIFTLIGLRYPISFVGAYFFAFKAILEFGCYYEFMDICPACNTENFLPKYFSQIHNSLLTDCVVDNHIRPEELDYGIITSFLKYKELKVCTFCSYLGLNWEQQSFHIKSGVLMLIGGLVSIPLAYISPYLLLGSYFFIISGILTILTSVSGSKKCPNCEYKSLIPIDSKGAESILEEKSIRYTPDSNSLNLPTISRSTNNVIIASLLVSATYLYYRLFLYFNSLN